jgi:hypothetical protein
VVTAGANVVLAEVVLTADPSVYHAFESNDPYIWTLPAETPAELFTTIMAVVLVDNPSKMAGVAVVADCAVRETTGAIPSVCG